MREPEPAPPDLRKNGPVPAAPDTALAAAAPAPSPAGMRASDRDRDRIADILREALAEGRLTAAEHSERIDLAYRARTVGELEPLVGDLPAQSGPDRGPDRPAPRPGGAPPSATGAASERLVAVFGGSTRKGRWRVGPHTTAFALFGGVEIDLTEAVFRQQEVVVNAVAIFGGVEIRVPENVTLRCTGTGIFGGFDVRNREADDPDAPIVVVTGFAVFGGVDARPKRGKLLRDLRDRMRRELGG
ncbi:MULTISPECIES: DUF1707 SHOCT-like domain-containing protein [Streptomyces]|uniref:DUF1707 and DUF2154 domain-containing protein n=2 Tax=Streptomyces TaxID=1883 RepID=A0A3M8EVM6_9ACTN|nr:MULTISPECIES: DUF1707 domain-containing protein [Streptomyces]KNE78874.1 hypothetical protein ADZ36_30785 [Streptomyces fradiae]OFA34021.1 hypothetical protein BEN35_31565 [Streptomyces fradiae]PQM20345.1 DUF1707 domain-containing protein [Streptomyces xinghaiensis]RKM94108.1 DUF1707 and DUF2154 domain-containing protein [Streptomyces xinghaiensis]RNC69541.1 DUF1707 and DUF2154 domain-containing protein [Streptomyces xinghaiensis]